MAHLQVSRNFHLVQLPNWRVKIFSVSITGRGLCDGERCRVDRWTGWPNGSCVPRLDHVDRTHCGPSTGDTCFNLWSSSCTSCSVVNLSQLSFDYRIRIRLAHCNLNFKHSRYINCCSQKAKQKKKTPLIVASISCILDVTTLYAY